MNLLESVETPKDRAPVVTLSGDPGMGKSNLAATFPKPIFIRVIEDGLQSIPVGLRPAALPVVTTTEALWDQMFALIEQDHDFETLVIDSVTMCEQLFEREICEAEADEDGNPISIKDALGGYGAGAAMVAAMHVKLRKGAGVLNKRKGMNIVFVAHAALETMKLPDKDDYQRYSLRLPAKSMSPYVDDVDIVGFVRLQTVIKGEKKERKRAVGNGDRELICHATPTSIAKNRYRITEPLDFELGVNPLTDHIPALKKGKS